MSADRVIGVDVGGTKILAALVAPDGRVEHRRERATPTGSQAELLDALQAVVEELWDDHVTAVGFGVPSLLDPKTRRALASVNVPIADLDLRGEMSARLRVPVAVENDANAAALAEWRAGAGGRVDDLVMLTLGTGVGGGVVLAGRLYSGWAEFGHIVVEYDGEPCGCGGHGHLESYASGSAATRRAQEAFGPSADAHRLVRLAGEGDEQAREILADIGRRLGAGIASLVNIFFPDVVAVGGGFAAAGDFLLGPAEEVARREALPPAREHFRLERARLGTAAGVVGAGLAAYEALAAA